MIHVPCKWFGERRARTGDSGLAFKLFEYDRAWNIGFQLSMVKNMERSLRLFASEELSSTHRNRFAEPYLNSLIRGQRIDGDFGIPGTWAVSPAPPEDEWSTMDTFVWLPTYLAVATLSMALVKCRPLGENIPGLKQSLMVGLDASAAKKLGGHGYDKLKMRLSGLEIFEMGETLTLLKNSPYYSTLMCGMLGQVYRETTELLRNQPTGQITDQGSWSPEERTPYEWIQEVTKPFESHSDPR